MTQPHPAERLLTEFGITPDGARVVGPVWAFRADAADMLALWRRLRDAHDRSGLWPFLIGDDLDRFAESVEIGDEEGPAEVARGLTLDVAARLAELRAGALEYVDEGEEMPPRGPADTADEQGEEDFHLAEKAGWIGLVRAEHGYLVPGLVGWGGAVNYDIEPAVHVAMLRHWHDRFGAELVGLSVDVLELRVPRPPTDPAEVFAVAEQQYWYCQDVVDQGVGTLDALMVAQVPAHRWFFWWD